MPKPKKDVPPYVAEGRFGIMNHVGSLWTCNTFETRGQAEQYLFEYARRNRNADLSKHKVVPVCVTVEVI